MKSLPYVFVLFAGIVPVTGQERTHEWTVEIPGPISDGKPSGPAPKPTPIDFTVSHSRTKRIERVEPPPMTGLPPLRGMVNVTVQMVEDPGLIETPPPLPVLEPEDPAVIARMEEMQQKHRGMALAFVCCEVVDHRRSLLRIYPSGKAGDEVTAVSNLDWNHYSGWAFWRTTFPDGTFQDTGLIMGIGNADSGRMREWKKEIGRENASRDFLNDLPDVEQCGPAFIVLDGDPDGPAMTMLRQAHELYKKEGARMEAAYHAREKAMAERKAYLLAHPPKPEDVTIRFWKRNQPAAQPTATTR